MRNSFQSHISHPWSGSRYNSAGCLIDITISHSRHLLPHRLHNHKGTCALVEERHWFPLLGGKIPATFRPTRSTRDKLFGQAVQALGDAVSSRGEHPSVRCRVPTSLIPQLFGAWPPGAAWLRGDMFRTFNVCPTNPPFKVYR
jgi:hypothetical protein